MELPEIKEEIESYECCGLICRLCLSEESLEDVFKDGFFHEWISDFLSIKITTNDRLSQAICAICRIRLADFHQYRIRCHEVQGVLQALADGIPMGTDVALAVDPNAVNQLQPIVEKKDPLIQCELCQKVFKDETELKNHKSIHAPEIVLCASCGELFETREQLYKHLESQTTGCDVNQTDSLINANQVEEVDSASEPLAPQAQKVESKVESKSKVSSEIVQLDSDSENSTKESSDKSLAQKNGSKSLTSTAIVKIDSDSENSGVECLSLDQGTRPKSRTSIEDSDIKNSEPESEQDPLCFDPCKEDVSAADKLDVEMELDEGEDKFEDENMDAKDEKYSSDDSSISPSKAVRNKKKRDVNGSRDHECRVCDKQLSSWEELLKHCDTKRHLNKVEKIRISGSESDSSSSVTSNTMSEKTNTDKSDQSEQASGDVDDEDDDDNDEKDGHDYKQNEDGRYACSECGRTFNRQCKLKNHKATHDKNYDGEQSDEESSMPAFSSDDSASDQEGENELEEKQEQEPGEKLEPELTQERTNGQEQQVKQEQKQTKEQRHKNKTEYRCDKCNKVYSNKSKFNSHIKNHRSNKRVKKSTKATDKQTKDQDLQQNNHCDICNKTYATRGKYISHVKYHRLKDEPKQQEYPCEECDNVFSMYKDLYNHKKYHKAMQRLKPTTDAEANTDKPIEANSNEQKVTTASLSVGAETRAANETQPFQCDFCPKSFATAKILLRHRRIIHGPKNHKCDVCDVQYTLRAGMTQHVYSKKHLKNLKQKWIDENKSSSHENEPDKSGKNIKNIKDSDLLQNDEIFTKYKHSRRTKNYNKQSKCDECDKVFPNVWSLSNHKKYHRPMRLECHICGRPCYSNAVLRKHLRTHQSPEERQRAKPPSDGKPLPRPFKCEFCPNTYVTHAALWTHTQVKHKNNTYECEICGYQFPLRELLNRHMKTHTAREHTKEDFQVLRKLAPKKDKVTNRKNNYADGMKKNESGSENRKTNKPTNVGTKKCAKPSTELPFPCDICEQSFETLVLLYRHKRYLHKPKRFKCPVCDKCFAYRKQRNMHMRGHDKLQSDTIKDFECDECHKIYPTWKALYAHVTIGHIKRKSLSEERTVPCPKCNKMFQTQAQTDLHLRVVHASVEYKCHICDIVFPIRVKLWEHMTHRHENQPTTSSASKLDESVGSVEQSDQKDADRDDQPTENETAQKPESRKQPQRNVKTRSDAKRRRE